MAQLQIDYNFYKCCRTVDPWIFHRYTCPEAPPLMVGSFPSLQVPRLKSLLPCWISLIVFSSYQVQERPLGRYDPESLAERIVYLCLER
ncbi:hypothetical protein Y1Q_0004725 [Alligator mississippiensis]|uniref:Uncharacterized protein n=1 Tax=Alligator mississippiensis TaxID=8496 RepID=A0A151NFI8_ALLMI|nr:hypothetical protein Y1Q_0004725 [Alligator mississippiensis]